MDAAQSHLRVVEIGNNVSAPYCCKLLADLGADVIKVEQYGLGDPLRLTGTFPDDPEDPTRGAFFRYLNTNKRSVTFDLNGKTDIDAILKLISESDLVVENLGAGVLEKLGLGFDQLKSANPTVSLIQISDFGQDGPNAHLPSTDFIVQALGGWISKHVSGRPNPVQVGGNLSDYASASYAACAALTAVKTARALGEAVNVDVSKQECLLGTLPQPTLFLETLKQMGMGMPEDRVFPVPGVVRCKDGYVGVNVLIAQHHSDCCNMMGVPEYIPKQLDLNHIGPDLDQFHQDIKPWLMEREAGEIVELCQAFRLPAVPVGNGRNLPENAQLKARFFYTMDPENQFTQPGLPYRLEKTPASVRQRAPRLGEHSDDVNKDVWQSERPSDPSNEPTARTNYLPFEGLKVIDLGTFWAGPFVSCYLGAQGADVIKVESIQRPDGFRYSMAYPPLGPDWYEQGGAWQGTNLNKRNLTLNLNSDEGKRIFERLISNADVIIENFAPRVIDNFGFSVQRMKELNPKLIIVRMPGFGLEGPWQDYVGWAMSFEQASGAAWVTGDPDGTPLNPGGFADPMDGLHALVALQAALDHRERTGEAQIIEAAQLELGACWTAEQVIAYSLTGKLQQRTGNRSETMAPQGVYLCEENEWIALSIRDDEDWGRFAVAIGSPEWAGDSRFALVKSRLAYHDEIDRLISDWCVNQSADVVVNSIRNAGVPIAKILTAPNMITDPHLAARGFYQLLVHATMGERKYPRWPMIQNPGTNGLNRTSSPTLGQHNAEILTGELGLTQAQIDELAAKEIIGTVPKGLG